MCLGRGGTESGAHVDNKRRVGWLSNASTCVCVCGVVQVLPPDVMLLAEPSPEDLLAAVEEAICRVPQLDPLKQHERVRVLSSPLRPASPLCLSQHSVVG